MPLRVTRCDLLQDDVNPRVAVVPLCHKVITAVAFGLAVVFFRFFAGVQ